MTALAGWENFYVIVGSSAGALIGLQFVVVTLIADVPIRGGPRGRRGVCDADDRSFRSRAVAVSDSKRALAGGFERRSSLGIAGPQRARVRDHRGSAYAKTNRVYS